MIFHCLVKDTHGNMDTFEGLVCLDPEDKARKVASHVAGIIKDPGALELVQIYSHEGEPVQWTYKNKSFTYYVAAS